MKCKFGGAGGLGGRSGSPAAPQIQRLESKQMEKQKQKETGEQLPKQKSNKSKRTAEAEKQQKQKSNKSKNAAEAEKQQKQKNSKSRIQKKEKTCIRSEALSYAAPQEKVAYGALLLVPSFGRGVYQQFTKNAHPMNNRSQVVELKPSRSSPLPEPSQLWHTTAIHVRQHQSQLVERAAQTSPPFL